MFNLLVSGSASSWEGSQPWSMLTARFKEFSGTESEHIQVSRPTTLKELEDVPTLVMYEWGTDGVNSDVVRYGFAHDLRVVRRELQFRFRTEKHCGQELLDDFASMIGLDAFERHRTHWAIKDGDLPRELVQQMVDGEFRTYRYEVVLSYAGEDEAYVGKVAHFLKDQGIDLFYAPFHEAQMWGTDMTEELDLIYRKEGRYCVMFVSKAYAEKAWPTRERRSAMSRAVQQGSRYILPCRFDKTEIPGLPPSVHYLDLNKKSPEEVGEMVVKVLRHKRK